MVRHMRLGLKSLGSLSRVVIVRVLGILLINAHVSPASLPVKTATDWGRKQVEKHVWVEVKNRKTKGKEVATLPVNPSPP